MWEHCLSPGVGNFLERARQPFRLRGPFALMATLLGCGSNKSGQRQCINTAWLWSNKL